MYIHYHTMYNKNSFSIVSACLQLLSAFICPWRGADSTIGFCLLHNR